MCACVCVRVSVCVRVCMCVRLCVSVHACALRNVPACTHACACMVLDECVLINMHDHSVLARAEKLTQTKVRADLHTNTPIYLQRVLPQLQEKKQHRQHLGCVRC